MIVTFTTITGQHLTMTCNLQQFLNGPVLSHLAAIQNDCDPVELVRDFLPSDVRDEQDDDLAELIADACLSATRYEPAYGKEAFDFREIVDIELEDDDMPDVRAQLIAPEPLAFHAPTWHPMPAA